MIFYQVNIIADNGIAYKPQYFKKYGGNFIKIRSDIKKTPLYRRGGKNFNYQ